MRLWLHTSRDYSQRYPQLLPQFFPQALWVQAGALSPEQDAGDGYESPDVNRFCGPDEAICSRLQVGAEPSIGFSKHPRLQTAPFDAYFRRMCCIRSADRFT